MILKKTAMIRLVGLFLISWGFISVSNAERPRVGGHVKLALYDYTSGERTYTDSLKNVQTAQGGRSAGMNLQRFTLYVSHEIKEMLYILVEPEFDAISGASPQMGKSIGGKYSPAAPSFARFQNAFIRVTTPFPTLLEISAGIFFPRFTLEYGGRLFIEEEYNGSRFATSEFLGQMYAMGVEIHRNFDIGSISLPVYLYGLNGSGHRFYDNNETPEVMVHVEPEMGPVKLSASFLAGKYDDESEMNVFRWSYGGQVTLGPVEVRAEAAQGHWDKGVFSQEFIDTMPQPPKWGPAEPLGYYGKIFYRPFDWFRAMVHYNYVEHNFIGSPMNGIKGKETYLTFTPGLQFFLFDALIIQAQCDIGRWKKTAPMANIEDELNFVRTTLGFRVTF